MESYTSLCQYQIIKLRRLLNCMIQSCSASQLQSPRDDDNDNNSYHDYYYSHYSYLHNNLSEMEKKKHERQKAKDQIAMAHEMLNEIRQCIFYIDDTSTITSNEELMYQLEIEVQEVCEYVYENTIGIECENGHNKNYNNQGHYGNHNNSYQREDEEPDLVDEIFFEESEEEYHYDDDDQNDKMESSTLYLQQNCNDQNNNTRKYKDYDENYDLHLSDDEDENDNDTTYHEYHSVHSVYSESDTDDKENEYDNISNDKNTGIHTGINSTIAKSISNKQRSPKSKPKIIFTKEELLQKQQEEQLLQQEITEMATQLKQSTMNINTTLTFQNLELDNVETLAICNLDKTKNIQEDVTEHVKVTGWKKNVGRWIVFFLILGTWIFCFLMIRVIPKRQNTCFFFCESNERDNNNVDYDRGRHDKINNLYDNDGDDGYTTYHTNKKRKRNSNRRSGSVDRRCQTQQQDDTNVDKDPNNSSCESVGGKENQECTRPTEYDEDFDISHRIEDIDESLQEDLIEEHLMEQKMGQRGSDNMNEAKEEQDEDFVLRQENDEWESNNNKNDYDKSDIVDTVSTVTDDHNDEYGDSDVDSQEVDGNYRYDNTDIQEVDTTFSYQDAVNAAIDNDSTSLKNIFDQQPDLTKVNDINGWSVFHEAARAGAVDCVRLLWEIIEDKPLITSWIVPEGNGVSALSMAEIEGHTAIVELLNRYVTLEKGKSNKEHAQGKTNVQDLNSIMLTDI